MNLNMEMGVLIENDSLASQVQKHFDALIDRVTETGLPKVAE